MAGISAELAAELRGYMERGDYATVYARGVCHGRHKESQEALTRIETLLKNLVDLKIAEINKADSVVRRDGEIVPTYRM